MVRSTSRRASTKAGSRPAPESLAEARRIVPELVEVRRHLHAHPELGHEEKETSKLVKDRLARIGLKPKGLGGTGVSADMGGRPGRTVMLRADMDALPIQEENDRPLPLDPDGKMHACGHDCHTSILLGVGRGCWRERAPTAGAREAVLPAGRGERRRRRRR